MRSDIVAKDFQHSNIFDLFQVSFGEKIDFWFQTCIVCHFELMWNFFFWIQINILNSKILRIWSRPPWTDVVSLCPFYGMKKWWTKWRNPLNTFKSSKGKGSSQRANQPGTCTMNPMIWSDSIHFSVPRVILVNPVVMILPRVPGYLTFLTFKTSFGMSLIVERWRYRTPLNIWMFFYGFWLKNKSIITLVLVNTNKYWQINHIVTRF